MKVISAQGDLPLKKTRESKYGDEIYFAEGKAPQPELHFDIEYDVVRHERRALNPQPHLVNTALTPREREQDLQANELVPITGRPAVLAAEVAQSKTAPLEKARAIYDYVFTTMRYEKTGTGWGRGDVLYACDAKKGNCTDFHSLFIAMARSQGIPARFEIGFPLPEDKHSGEIAGYHCWSDFYVDGKGWIPVDISEAWKHPDKRDYFFGSHDANRVQFSMGRDLRLNAAARQQTAELLCVSLCGSGRERVRQRLASFFVRGCARREGQEIASQVHAYELIGAQHYPPGRDFPAAGEGLWVAEEGRFRPRAWEHPRHLLPGAGGWAHSLAGPALVLSLPLLPGRASSG